MPSLFRHLSPGLLLTASLAAAPLTITAQTTLPTADPTASVLSTLAPDMRNVILLYDAIKGTPFEQLTPQDARQQFAAQDAEKILARASGFASATPVGRVVDGMTVPGENGTLIPIRIYYPVGNGPLPVIVYYHGGGFVVATIDTYDESARHLCVDTNAIVVSVEYRKAPEAPFPAAYNDAIAAYSWVTNNIAAYGGSANKVAVAGESAGGNLAAEVAIAGRNGVVQMPTHQLLVYPETTSNLTQESETLYTSSALPLYTAELPYFDAQYLQSPSDMTDPRAVPIDNNLAGLPPATIIAAQVDPLMSDGQDYYSALLAAKDTVTYKLYTGTTHEFFGMGDVVKKARNAELFGAAQLAASFK